MNYEAILSEIQELYLADATPWIIGFSGGKVYSQHTCEKVTRIKVTDLPSLTRKVVPEKMQILARERLSPVRDLE